MRCRVAVTLTGAAVGLAGCGAAVGEDPAPHPDVTDEGAAVALVEEAEADLVLVVSNQSFDDAEVRLSVEIDGLTVVDGDFHVGDQHRWVWFPLRLPSGAHEVVAESDSGATLREQVEVPRGERRYAVVEHWTEDDSPATADAKVELTWQLLEAAPTFA